MTIFGKSGCCALRLAALSALFTLTCCSSGEASKELPARAATKPGVLVDFESGIPCSDKNDPIGFRKGDRERGKVVEGGAAGSARSAVFRLDSGHYDLYLQGEVRRKYLATGSQRLAAPGPNLISFWVKLPADSPLIGREATVKIGDRVIGRKLNNGKTMTLMSYHWRPGDQGVGGPSNHGLMTDSNMHGYSEFRFTDQAAGKWVQVSLSPSAFQVSRNYFHFYGANAITDDLDLFGSLRQLQFRVEAKLEHPIELQLDEVRLETRPPTAVFSETFKAARVPAKGDYAVPVTLKNPTGKERHYRVFISSFLGAERELLNKIAALVDDLTPMRGIQGKVDADGGVGAVELVGEDGSKVTGRFQEIVIPAGGTWQGELVHHLKPAMLGRDVLYKFRDYEFPVRRDTLTSSVIVWDPNDPVNREMDYLASRPHNSDDANHTGPAGFPKQVRPAQGWRSEDIPLNQVGGYFVSVLTLVD